MQCNVSAELLLTSIKQNLRCFSWNRKQRKKWLGFTPSLTQSRPNCGRVWLCMHLLEVEIRKIENNSLFWRVKITPKARNVMWKRTEKKYAMRKSNVLFVCCATPTEDRFAYFLFPRVINLYFFKIFFIKCAQFTHHSHRSYSHEHDRSWSSYKIPLLNKGNLSLCNDTRFHWQFTVNYCCKMFKAPLGGEIFHGDAIRELFASRDR